MGPCLLPPYEREGTEGASPQEDRDRNTALVLAASEAILRNIDCKVAFQVDYLHDVRPQRRIRPR